MGERIRHAQEYIGQTLRRARLVEDRTLARTVRDLGERLAHINFGLLQLVRMHDLANSAFDRPIEEFRYVLHRLIEILGPVNLVCVEDQVYVNDIRARFDVNLEHAVELEGMLRRHNVGGLTYYRALDAEQVRTVFSLFAEEPASERPRTVLQARLDESGLSSIELQPVFRFRADSGQVKKTVAEAVRVCIEVIAGTFANMGANRLPNPLPIRRAVHDLLDATESKDIARLALEMDGSTPPFARHTLAVTLLSILLGRTVGLSHASLANLGIAAMLHDVGFCVRQGARKTSFEDHVSAGLTVLLRQRGFHDARIQRLLVVLEHHDPHTRSGGAPTLHARIVHIADDYDAMTRRRADDGPQRTPSDAVRLMAAHGGGVYDPGLLQLFVNLMGAYPPGSLLRLTDGTLVRSVSGVRSPETFDQPLCRVLRLADDSEPTGPLSVDLAKGGRIAEVVGSTLRAATEPPAEPAAEPEPAPPPTSPLMPLSGEPTPPPRIEPPRARPGLILPGIRMPKPAKKKA